MTTYKITHDPQSGAFYVRLREGDYHETIPLGDPGLGAVVDVDAEGNVLGLEYLSFEEFAEVIAKHDGALELPEKIGAWIEVSGEGVTVEMPDGGEDAALERIDEEEPGGRSGSVIRRRPAAG